MNASRITAGLVLAVLALPAAAQSPATSSAVKPMPSLGSIRLADATAPKLSAERRQIVTDAGYVLSLGAVDARGATPVTKLAPQPVGGIFPVPATDNSAAEPAHAAVIPPLKISGARSNSIADAADDSELAGGPK